jgi:hypothetical protein
MNGLMLHCGAHLKSREDVFAVALPKPTKSYVPLSHQSLVTRIEKQLDFEGITIREEKLALAHEGQRLFGLMQVQIPSFEGQEYGCVLGLRNSYDRSCSAGLCIGATVFVCDNLSFHGSHITFQRKHTANLLRDLAWIISEAVTKLPLLFAEQSKTFELYRETPIADEEAHDLVIRLLDAGAINMTDIRMLLKEWREPRHEAFQKAGKSAWRLFNAATETIKGDLWGLPVRSRTVHKVLNDRCGIGEPPGLTLDAPPKEIVELSA